MNLKIYPDSTNYTCQVIRLPAKKPVPGLDNLVEVVYQGNSVLVSKDSPEDILYLFFPAESQISSDFLKSNNLVEHYCALDPGNLREELIAERVSMNRMYEAIVYRGKPEKYIFGHFHESHREFIEGIEFILLNIEEEINI